MKRIIQFILKVLGRWVLARQKPAVIGITGSVGKTSAKEAIYSVLAHKYKARRNIKNYNNEIGLPLTIIGAGSPGRSIWGWLKVFGAASRKILFGARQPDQVLILEMGVDRPGDMAYLTSIAQCKIGVVTLIGQSHLEYFGSVDALQKEKGDLIKSLDSDGWSLLNYDNEKTRQIAKWSRAKVLTYGLRDGADIVAKELRCSYENNGNGGLQGISFKLLYNGSFVPVLLPNVIGQPAVYAALAGAAAGIAMGMNLVDIAQALKGFKSPKGRMNIIPGLYGSVIIDDTYNSAPSSVLSALETVKAIPVNKPAVKIAVLGDMLELGKKSGEEHEKIGRGLKNFNINTLITVGELSKKISAGWLKSGQNEDRVKHFDNSHEAGLWLKKKIKSGDLIFVKGSQGVRMEKVVWQIMAEPGKAGELLVRQGREWRS